MNTLPRTFFLLAALALPLPSVADHMGGKECDLPASEALQEAPETPAGTAGADEPMSGMVHGHDADARMQAMEERMQEMAERSCKPGMGRMMGGKHGMGHDPRNCRMGRMQERMMHQRLEMLEKRLDLMQTMLQMLAEPHRHCAAGSGGH